MRGCADNAGKRSDLMCKLLVATAILAGALGVSAAQADTVGAVAGAQNERLTSS